MVVAIIRMKKDITSGKGLERHANCALERRYKIEHLSEHVERISTCILNGNKVPQVLKESQSIYRWKLPSYQQIVLTHEV
jgi:hypothetical protein